jgi:hypothetical protein
MEKKYSLDRKLETFAWGALLIWWGLRWWPLEFLPNGAGLLGSGLILLVLNAIRVQNGIRVKGFTTVVGILLLTFGGLLWAREIMQLSFEIPLFEIVLIGMGVFLLGREFLEPRKTETGNRINSGRS